MYTSTLQPTPGSGVQDLSKDQASQSPRTQETYDLSRSTSVSSTSLGSSLYRKDEGDDIWMSGDNSAHSSDASFLFVTESELSQRSRASSPQNTNNNLFQEQHVFSKGDNSADWYRSREIESATGVDVSLRVVEKTTEKRTPTETKNHSKGCEPQSVLTRQSDLADNEQAYMTPPEFEKYFKNVSACVNENVNGKG